MASADRVLSALNFLTGEGASHYPDDVDADAIEALISDYFNEGPSDDESDDKSSHRNGGNSNDSAKFKDVKLVGQQESTVWSESTSEGKYLK